MRFPTALALALASLLPMQVMGGIFGGGSSSSSSAADSAPSASPASSGGGSSNSSAASGVSPEVAFLQTLQTAQISSMSCLITLVNMTTGPIGSCLGLGTLAELVVGNSANSSASFSGQLSSYLTTACAATQCTSADISDAQAQLSGSCGGGSNTQLIQVLNAVLENYSTSYRTLACSVHFNGTADLCLPATLNSSDTANSNAFFNDLISGSSLSQYQSSVFTSASCTGCMYEMYKASVYMISAIRGNQVTQAFGDHLKNDCPSNSNGINVDWSNVEDQQIPDALQVQQSTASPSKGTRVEVGSSRFSVWGLTGVGLLMGTGWIVGRV